VAHGSQHQSSSSLVSFVPGDNTSVLGRVSPDTKLSENKEFSQKNDSHQLRVDSIVFTHPVTLSPRAHQCHYQNSCQAHLLHYSQVSKMIKSSQTDSGHLYFHWKETFHDLLLPVQSGG
jgi:hypothetical protein